MKHYIVGECVPGNSENIANWLNNASQNGYEIAHIFQVGKPYHGSGVEWAWGATEIRGMIVMSKEVDQESE